MPKKSNNDTNPTRLDSSKVQVIGRAVKILRILRDTGGLNLSQLSREVGLPHSTVHRIVGTLKAENLISTDPSNGRIELGIELLTLGAAVMDDIRTELRPYLRSLSIDLDETIDLAIMKNKRMLFIDQIPKPHRLEAVSKVGASFPLHCTANGKIFLAEHSNEQIEQFVPEQLETFTPNTLQTRAHLIRELEIVRDSGYALDREEYTIGICAVGIGIPVSRKRRAYITVPVPSVRFYGNEDRIVSTLLKTRSEINLRFNSSF